MRMATPIGTTATMHSASAATRRTPCCGPRLPVARMGRPISSAVSMLVAKLPPTTKTRNGRRSPGAHGPAQSWNVIDAVHTTLSAANSAATFQLRPLNARRSHATARVGAKGTAARSIETELEPIVFSRRVHRLRPVRMVALGARTFKCQIGCMRPRPQARGDETGLGRPEAGPAATKLKPGVPAGWRSTTGSPHEPVPCQDVALTSCPTRLDGGAYRPNFARP